MCVSQTRYCGCAEPSSRVFSSPTEWRRREQRPDGRSAAERVLGVWMTTMGPVANLLVDRRYHFIMGHREPAVGIGGPSEPTCSEVLEVRRCRQTGLDRMIGER